MDSNTLSRFGQDGFQVLESVVPAEECELLAGELTPLFEKEQKLASSKKGGLRNLLSANGRVSRLAFSKKVISILRNTINGTPFPVRAIFFDKTPVANWLVPWHQDLAIAVAERIDTPGFTGWSMKDGVHHVHPPGAIIETMITLRLHLDDCTADNGALRVIPGSHLRGKLCANEISVLAKSIDSFTCEVQKGGLLIMRPLILHASSPATNPSHRRVLQLEYASQHLPNGLRWFEN